MKALDMKFEVSGARGFEVTEHALIRHDSAVALLDMHTKLLNHNEAYATQLAMVVL